MHSCAPIGFEILPEDGTHACKQQATMLGVSGREGRVGQGGRAGLQYLRFKPCRLQSVLLAVNLGCYNAKAAAGADRRRDLAILAIPAKCGRCPFFPNLTLSLPCAHVTNCTQNMSERSVSWLQGAAG